VHSPHRNRYPKICTERAHVFELRLDHDPKICTSLPSKNPPSGAQSIRPVGHDSARHIRSARHFMSYVPQLIKTIPLSNAIPSYVSSFRCTLRVAVRFLHSYVVKNSPPHCPSEGPSKDLPRDDSPTSESSTCPAQETKRHQNSSVRRTT